MRRDARSAVRRRARSNLPVWSGPFTSDRNRREPFRHRLERFRRPAFSGVGGSAGLTLLETMVALVILGLVIVGYLDVFAASSRSARQAQVWSQAVAYAEDAMEAMKIQPETAPVGRQRLGGGFERAIEMRALDPDIRLVTVIVYLPEGGNFTVSRLFEASP